MPKLPCALKPSNVIFTAENTTVCMIIIPGFLSSQSTLGQPGQQTDSVMSHDSPGRKEKSHKWDGQALN